MNLWQFKQKINNTAGWENMTERFLLFRTWVENAYVGYLKNWDLEKSEILMNVQDERAFLESSVYRDMKADWKSIDYNMLVRLYSSMGWKLDVALKEKGLNYCDYNACLYYDVDYDEVYQKIQAMKDPVDFTYAAVQSVINISKDSKLYTEFGRKVIQGLREYQLEECLAWMQGGKKKVFVAMCFAEELGKARRGIERAVTDCGYEPVLIDVKEHNNQIVPEIYKEIEESAFVIADLSKQRGGVYYEAGYATAKGKTVILSCRKQEQKEVHFDVAQINMIFWENEKDLRERLVKRRCATGGRGEP